MPMRLTDFHAQYLAALLDSEGQALDRGKSYELKLPANIPAAHSLVSHLYANQTRLMLNTSQRYPKVGSSAFGNALSDSEGARTLYLGPQPPKNGKKANWIETLPGRGYFAILCLYSRFGLKMHIRISYFRKRSPVWV